MAELHLLQGARQTHGEVVCFFVRRVQQLLVKVVLAAAQVVLELFDAAAAVRGIIVQHGVIGVRYRFDDQLNTAAAGRSITGRQWYSKNGVH